MNAFTGFTYVHVFVRAFVESGVKGVIFELLKVIRGHHQSSGLFFLLIIYFYFYFFLKKNLDLFTFFFFQCSSLSRLVGLLCVTAK